MKNINAIAWLFPVLFMIHDFEEIILLEAWRKRYKSKLEKQKLKKIIFTGCQNTPAFTIGVAIEFLIFSIVSYVACSTQYYSVWYAFFFGFILHLFGHIITTILYKHYVPGVITGILFLPYCAYLFYISGHILSLSISDKLLYCCLGIILMFLIVIVLHKCMDLFERIIKSFSISR